MKTTTLLITIIFLVSCQNQNKNVNRTFDFSYEIRSYNNYPTKQSISQYEYYNSDNKLIRRIDEGCTKYLYNRTGKLSETIWSRNCESSKGGKREIFLYDSSGNLIGKYLTNSTKIKLDTIHFEQTYFYDKINRLIKEKTKERTISTGERLVTWNYYSYQDTVKDSVKIKENDIIQWNGSYKYDSNGRLIEFKKVRNNDYEIDYNIFNALGQLIERGTKTNEVLICPYGIFTHPQRKFLYFYDTKGFQYKEEFFLDGKLTYRTINIKMKKY